MAGTDYFAIQYVAKASTNMLNAATGRKALTFSREVQGRFCISTLATAI